VVILLKQLWSAIFLLTALAALLSFWLGEWNKARCLVTIILIVCIANAIGEYSGQDAGTALVNMSAKKARVLRGGVATEVDVQDIVFGDVVLLRAGEMVPADMMVIESVDLKCNEAVLTGEPHEVAKTMEAKEAGVAFPTNMLFSMTSVTTGYGMGEVTATGMKTQVGLIAKRLKSNKDSSELNPLQRSINLLGLTVACGVCVGIVIATAIAYYTGYENPGDRPCPENDEYCLLQKSILRGVIMSVALIPHGLPFVVMIMMRVSAQEMLAKGGKVAKVTAVDHLGATL